MDPAKGQETLKQLQVIASQAKNARELTSFIDANISKVDTHTADSLFAILEQFYDQHLPALNENFAKILTQSHTVEKLNELEYPFDVNKIKNDDTLKQWLLNQTEGKLSLDQKEGDYYWRVDYTALNQAYAPKLSDEIKSYLSIQAAESKQNFFRDGSIKVTRDELGDRLLNAEGYLVKYPSGQKKTVVQALYLDYLKAYIYGYRYDAIDENTMKLLPTVKQSYAQLVNKQPDSKTAQIVKEYLVIINENKDVIYDPGIKGESIIGSPKTNIARFWNDLDSRVHGLIK